MKKLKFNEGDTCAYCGSNSLDYGSLEIADGGLCGLYYSWTCLDCKTYGREYYDLVFDGHYKIHTPEGYFYSAGKEGNE